MAKRAQASSLSHKELLAELRKRERRLRALRRRHGTLMRKAEEVAKEIAALGGLAGPGAGKRFRNDSNLVESLAKLLKGRAMRVIDAVAAVQKAGYKTTSPNFRTIVNQALVKNKRFKRVGRGRYTVK